MVAGDGEKKKKEEGRVVRMIEVTIYIFTMASD
jgi:hypothetical protein